MKRLLPIRVFSLLCVLVSTTTPECVRELPLDLAAGQESKEIVIHDDIEDCESVIEIKNQDCFGHMYIELEVESRIEKLKAQRNELKKTVEVLNKLDQALLVTSKYINDLSSDEEDPPSGSSDPVPITKDPASITKDPVPITKDPASITKDPVSISKDPVSITKDPVSISKDPVPISKDPVPITKDPVPITKDPVTISQDPVQIQSSTTTIDLLLLRVSDVKDVISTDAGFPEIQLKMVYFKRAVNRVQLEEEGSLGGSRESFVQSKLQSLQSNIGEASEELKKKTLEIKTNIENVNKEIILAGGTL